MSIEASLRESLEASDQKIEELVKSVRRSAVESGLADVAYAEMDSPIGPLTLSATRRGLARVDFAKADDVLEYVALALSPRVVRSPERVDDARRQLDEYFAGSRTKFSVRLDWSSIGGFRREVLRATAGIPFGQVITYKEVARRAGNDRAMRAAGSALGSNPVPVIVPCHRVLRTGGGLGGYGGGLDKKRFLLELEGVVT